MPRLRCCRPYGGADERDAGEVGVLEIGADAHERPLGAEARAEQVEHRGPLLEHLEQPPVVRQLVGAELVEHPGGAADVQGLLPGLEDVAERRPEPAEERPLALGERRVLEAAAQKAGAEPTAPRQVSFRYWPAHSARPESTGSSNVTEPLRDAAGRRDHDDHDDVRLQEQHLDVPDDRRLERRRGHEREQVRQLARAPRSSRAARSRPGSARPERSSVELGRPRLEPIEQPVDEEPVAGVGRNPPRRRVRMREQPLLLEHGQLVAHRRRGDREPGPLDERLRPDRRPGRDVLLDDAGEDQLLPLGETKLLRVRHSPKLYFLQGFRPCSSAVTPPPRKRPRRVSAEAAVSPLRQAEPLHARQRVRVDGAAHARERERLVQTQAQHQPLPAHRLRLEQLLLPRRPPPLGERADVRAQARAVPPAQTADGRDRADPDAEVVAPEPVAEVVARLPARHGRSSPSRTSGSPRRRASRPRARSSPPSPPPAARARRRARG